MYHVCAPDYLCICVSASRICVSLHRCIRVSVHVCNCASEYLCIDASVYLCICVSVYLCICVSVYLYICVSVYSGFFRIAWMHRLKTRTPFLGYGEQTNQHFVCATFCPCESSKHIKQVSIYTTSPRRRIVTTTYPNRHNFCAGSW